MESINTTHPQNLIFKFNLREAGVFLLLLFLNFKFISITVLQNRSLIIDLIVYALFIITFNYSNWTYKSLISTFLLVGAYTAINFSAYKLNVLVPLLVIQAVSGIRFRRYLWINLMISGTMLAGMYLVYGQGENWINWSFVQDRRVRMNFGFNHPNTAAMYYFCFLINVMLVLCFSKWKKYIPYYLIMIIPLWLFVYRQTGSRSFVISLIVLYASYFYYYLGILINKKKLLVTTRYLFISLVLLYTVLTVYLALAKDNFIWLDRILSGRLKLYNDFLKTLTPVDFIFGSSEYKNSIIDSSYVHLLFEGGIIFFLLFCWFYFLSAYQMVSQKAWISICIIMSFMAYGLMESIMLYGILIGSHLFWILLYFYYRGGKMLL